MYHIRIAAQLYTAHWGVLGGVVRWCDVLCMEQLCVSCRSGICLCCAGVVCVCCAGQDPLGGLDGTDEESPCVDMLPFEAAEGAVCVCECYHAMCLHCKPAFVPCTYVRTRVRPYRSISPRTGIKSVSTSKW